ncbi:Meckel syndrome type 1 protein [Chrysoperla carnea]|uniref:Meckel syndrome type 1 protein n=1 Tax=Chrysoperla carnea TaxID=189513 RepID=UPI001D06C8CF|nr:Meckel syndrome type 1 protein [Chrysoperla carnea]
MYIMADLKYAKGLTDNNLIEVKKEIVLCEIKWDPKRSSLFIYPDFSKNEPYMLEIDDDSRNIYYYWIENASEQVSDTIRFKEFQLKQDLRKRQSLLKTKDLQKIKFDIPPNNEIHFHIFIEILTANYFEADNLFIQYYIDLPENWRIHDDDKLKLSGVTQSAKTRTIRTDKYDIYDSVAMFGYPFQLTFIYNYKNFDQSLGLLHCPTIYFEIISKDTWNRYRTEGYAYKTIPINQFGTQHCSLQCIYIKPRTRWGELHHFFIGGCSELDDITWLGTPTNHQEDMTINKFGVITEGTGMIDIKFQVLHHSQAFIKAKQQSVEQAKDHFLHTHSVIKSINEVLKAFKKARDQMNEARKTLY